MSNSPFRISIHPQMMGFVTAIFLTPLAVAFNALLEIESAKV